MERKLFYLERNRNPFPLDIFNYDDEKRIAENHSSVEKKLAYWLNIRKEYRKFILGSDDDHLMGQERPVGQSVKYMFNLKREIHRLTEVIEIEKGEGKSEKEPIDFQHPIFTSEFASKLFEHLHNEFNNGKHHLMIQFHLLEEAGG